MMKIRYRLLDCLKVDGKFVFSIFDLPHRSFFGFIPCVLGFHSFPTNEKFLYSCYENHHFIPHLRTISAAQDYFFLGSIFTKSDGSADNSDRWLMLHGRQINGTGGSFKRGTGSAPPEVDIRSNHQ